MFRALINVCRYGPGVLTSSSRVKRLCARSPLLSSLYYCFISRQFRREHFGVLTACSRSESGRLASVLGNLRRNIHRIEKGLCTHPRKPVFARDYILETVRALRQISEESCSIETCEWGRGVLETYFQTVPREGPIARAYDEFQALFKDDDSGGESLDQDEERITVSYDAFMDLCCARKSVRYYEDRAVPRDVIEKALAAALQSPSACNRQAFELLLVDDKALLGAASRLPMGSETFAENMQGLVFVIGDLSAYFDERDRHIIYIDGGLMAMSFCLALKTMGVASCIINWPDIAERDASLAQMFDLPPHRRCVFCISIGYADRSVAVPSSCKKTVDSVLVIPEDKGA